MTPNHATGNCSAEEKQRHLTIENPSSCGQGYCPNHTENPHHETLTQFGWKYSHTTRIGHAYPAGAYYAHHTYIFPGTQWAVGVNCQPGWRCDAGKIGSGRRTAYFSHQLARYLKRKTRELQKAIV